ncbi:MAG TPA: hypothetical protein VJM31_03560 [Vicinamibacterales bacterium]|nr:hypothetical protein [Vicinamibacterales bacterium]
MNKKSLFASFWEKEAKTTSKVLARIPEGSDYRPDPKSRTALGRRARALRPSTARIADGVEFSIRYRPSPRPDYDVSAPDGIDCATGLRSERGRAVGGLEKVRSEK